MEILIILAAFGIQLFALYRNDWVYRQRCIVLDLYGQIMYETLPPYRVMFFKVWVWDVDKFLFKGEQK